MRVTTCSHPVAKGLLCLFILFSTAYAGRGQRAKRDGASLISPGPPSETLADEVREAAASTSAAITESPASSLTTWTTWSSAIPQSTSTVNATLFGLPIPEGELPLEPEITPGFAVAGVILLSTGVVYAVVGIKTRWIHSFLSTAFLGSLGASVLILYVMTHPVTRAIQGAYVVAVVCTGLVLGGLALVFKEITECLACLLGGFCLSMWLLTLQPGGLILHTGGKVGFIAAFTLAGFGLYFTPWTRNYGMIACIAFSGATVAVLGIDCFSRAGYKEFWVYLWELNDNIFPLGTTTYPLTRGIRVEIAVTILIFLAGVVSQIKLWRIIKDRRAKRDAERAEVERNLRAEEENAGREIEKRTAREKRQWERVYGDGARSPLGDSADSGVGDMESEKRMHMRNSVVSTVALGTRPQSPTGNESIHVATKPTCIGTGLLALSVDDAMTPFRVSKIIAADRVLSKDEDRAGITVMVAHDDMPSRSILDDALSPPPPPPPPKEAQMTDTEGTLQQQDDSIPAAWQRNSVIREVLPNITPLPFTVPEEQDTEKTEEDRSSMATFADQDVEDGLKSRPITREGVGDTMMRRAPSGSFNMNRDEQSKAGGAGEEESCEVLDLELEMARGAGAHNESESVAANLDEMSCVSDPVSLHGWDTHQEYLTELKLDGQTEESQDGQSALHTKSITPTERPLRCSSRKQLPTSMNETSDPVYSSSVAAQSCPDIGVAQVEEDGQPTNVDAPAPQQPFTAPGGEERKPVKRTASVDSVAASLTHENLPSGLSRVAMSYRTNEWAKHLSVAETPEPDTLQMEQHAASVLPQSDMDAAGQEGPAPLDIAELQQTAENATPPPAATRSASPLSNYHTVITRSNSRASLSAAQPYRSLSGTLRVKASGLLAEPIAEEGGSPVDNNMNITPAAVPEEGPLTGGSLYDMASTGPQEQLLPASASMSTPNLSNWLANSSMQQQQQPPQPQASSSPPTLMGMREMLLRTKVSAGLLSTPTAAEAIYTNNYPEMNRLHRRTPSSETAGSIPSYPLLDSPTVVVDADDIPLSHRRAMIRQSVSLGNLSSPNLKPAGGAGGHMQLLPYRSQSRASMQGPFNSNNSYSNNNIGSGSGSNNISDNGVNGVNGVNGGSRSEPTRTAAAGMEAAAGAATFESHQPAARKTNLPSEAARQAQLANFRNSVAADLAASSVMDGVVTPYTGGGGGWDSPTTSSAMGTYGSSTPMLHPSFGGFGIGTLGSTSIGAGVGGRASAQSLRQYYNGNNSQVVIGGGATVEAQRKTLEQTQTQTHRSPSFHMQALMERKEMEAARREAERAEAERAQREFDERMRSGALLGVHRDALRRMQARAGTGTGR